MPLTEMTSEANASNSPSLMLVTEQPQVPGWQNLEEDKGAS